MQSTAEGADPSGASQSPVPPVREPGIANSVRQGPSDRYERVRYAAGSEFSSIDEEVQQVLCRSMTYRLYGPNEFIYLQDDDADFLFFVRSGHVRLSYLLEDGSTILFGIMPMGESFGELGVFEGAPHYDMATSIGDTSVYSIPAQTFRTLAARHPRLDLALGRTVARRYRSYISLTRSLGLKTLPARLSQCLLRLADGLGTRTSFCGRDVPFIGAFVTQTELGLMARAARGNVNRALKSWEKSGWIAIHQRCILVLDRPSLEALALDDGL